ncbi:MAG: restriction endonuclease subunit S [Planctomycetes bacterium]|nr:restriction endonuclease subunit S [Planctomycetota bacterium]
MRRIATGAEIGPLRRFQVSRGQFIVSRIDARNGAMGIIPQELDGAVVTNDFPAFDADPDRLEPPFLGWLSRTRGFVDMCRSASEGTTNRVRLKENRFLHLQIPLPSLAEQRRIVARINGLVARIDEASRCMQAVQERAGGMLRAAFAQLVRGAPCCKMAVVAPLVRRRVDLCEGTTYPELGIRSFGRGTFHKPALDYIEVGSKKLYRIEPGDLVFNNVFAWEGAIAVSRPEDKGRVGSHRFVTCRPDEQIATADFLCFYFLTPEGLERIGKASPGGAGRNRTLGLEKLAQIEVPTPKLEHQLRFDRLQAKVREALAIQERSKAELNKMLPSILDRAFKGAL